MVGFTPWIGNQSYGVGKISIGCFLAWTELSKLLINHFVLPVEEDGNDEEGGQRSTW